MDTGGSEGLHLVGRGSLAAGDDGSGMAHASARWRRLPGDEAHDRLLDVRLYIGSRDFFGRASNFAYQDDGFRLRVLIEQLQRVDVGSADDGIAADADRCRLADAALGELVDGWPFPERSRLGSWAR